MRTAGKAELPSWGVRGAGCILNIPSMGGPVAFPGSPRGHLLPGPIADELAGKKLETLRMEFAAHQALALSQALPPRSG